jgi:alpha-D-ribose 1-methylphosphonate 5-triphosphate synthase subunit PhnG
MTPDPLDRRRRPAELPPDAAQRRDVMALVAEATRDELLAAVGALGDPAYTEIRPAEVGLVMVRGRIGGDGGPFNLGEATVSRASVRLADGAIGFGYVLGRDLAKARLGAVLDAAVAAGLGVVVEDSFCRPVSERLAKQRRIAAERTAATRVDFFTLVRGEDQP